MNEQRLDIFKVRLFLLSHDVTKNIQSLKTEKRKYYEKYSR